MANRNAIEACQDIPALEVAHAAGIHTKRKGSKEWCCCPFHREKTPSMMFDALRFHCFGCGADGDAIDFYGRLHNISDVKTAAEELAQSFSVSFDAMGKYTPPPKPPEVIIQEKQDAKDKLDYDKACRDKHYADEVIDVIQECADHAIQCGMDPHEAYDACWNNAEFCKAVKMRSDAEMQVEIIKEGERHAR